MKEVNFKLGLKENGGWNLEVSEEVSFKDYMVLWAGVSSLMLKAMKSEEDRDSLLTDMIAGLENSMTVREENHRGHPMELVDDVWKYSDTGQPVMENKDRPCNLCGKHNTPEGHDACLGTLPGRVMNACCGHGDASHAYIMYSQDEIVRGAPALSLMLALKGGKRAEDK